MGSTLLTDPGPVQRAPSTGGPLYVAWQERQTRAIEPVGRLQRNSIGSHVEYEFRYLRRAQQVTGFRPFIGFPDMYRTYRSTSLFPLFENRLMPRTRRDYPSFVEALGLAPDADPFEVLARSEGRRLTDTIEVFPEPTFIDGTVHCRFLAHGVRHVDGAHDAIDSLSPGDSVYVLLDPQNPKDSAAVLLRDDAYHPVGWLPRYLTSVVHAPLNRIGPDAIEIRVQHIGDRQGPSHLRLLCDLMARWPAGAQPPFSGPDYQAIQPAR